MTSNTTPTTTAIVSDTGAYAQAGAFDFVMMDDGLIIEHENFSCQWEPDYAEFGHAELTLDQARALRDLLNKALPA